MSEDYARYETSGGERAAGEMPGRQDMERVLAALNQAQAAYYRAPGRDEKNAADRAFQAAWDWFEERGIQIQQDGRTRQWALAGLLTLTIGSNTYSALLAELKRHHVTLVEANEDCLKAIFPPGTRKIPQPDIPATFLLTLPDGWRIQEMRLYHSRLPYSSILVYGPDQDVPPGGVGISYHISAPPT